MKTMPANRSSLTRTLALAVSGAVALAGMTAPLAAQSGTMALRDSLPIGSNSLCQAQIATPRAGDGLFDRNYQVVCQDAATPVGTLQVLRDGNEAAVLAQANAGGATCVSTSGQAPEGLPAARQFLCTSSGGLQRLLIVGNQGGTIFAATGVAAYQDALRLGLGNLATGRLVPGTVEIPLTQAGDASAFARAQAEAISADAALAEAYRRSNAGEFAEAAEFFAAAASALEGGDAVEAQLNAALQQSNLDNYLEAALIFVEAQQLIGDDPVLVRLSRNFEALDAINRDSPDEAILLLDTPLPPSATGLDDLRQLAISQPLSARLVAEQGNAISGATGALTVLERADLLDAQGDYIRASALRALDREGEARASLLAAQSGLVGVRDGRVASVLWLRAQILAELAGIAERGGSPAEAEALYAQAVALVEANYPASPALASARAQMAGYLVRAGREEEALTLYRALVSDAETKPTGALRRLLAPYFALLADRGTDAGAANELFVASQLLQRPGLAQTQAVLARELSGGSDEAAQLFRQSLNLARAIERLRAGLAQTALDAEGGDGQATAAMLAQRQELTDLQARQLEVQQQLAQYPRYRMVSETRMQLADLTATLGAGEAYFKLVMLEDAAYAIFAQSSGAVAYRVGAAPDEIGAMVDALRDSIAIEQAGQTITYPFEMSTARQLYSAMFEPVDGQLRQVTHLVFEPDGDLLRLPINLLVMDDASVARYTAQAEGPLGDPYDYRGTQWLGRTMQISTAVSPTAFRDVRAARASDARMAYLGLGNNQPLGANALPNTGTRSGGMVDDRCHWSPSTWNNPIRADELRTAETILARGGGQGTLLTGSAFSDTGLKAMPDLDQYRILHFATHGLVTSPQPQCPPRPALLTSFGDADSDGLLSFAEIFDLTLDADLVILSACNTASAGGLTATREAGISGGGDFALDGLVRAFVGAGGRTVVASHWPVPDDYNATNRLISGFFAAEQGVTATEALRQAQLGLMDDANTSHPFYWSAFAVVGDGNVPVRR